VWVVGSGSCERGRRRSNTVSDVNVVEGSVVNTRSGDPIVSAAKREESRMRRRRRVLQRERSDGALGGLMHSVS
jgi:hypothetical protein